MRRAYVLVAVLCLPAGDTERCDRLERNHVCDERGRESLDQVIAWDWRAERGEWECCGWQLTKTCGVPVRTPGGWQVGFRASAGVVIVRSPAFAETWTLADPELADRANVPVERRRKLWR